MEKFINYQDNSGSEGSFDEHAPVEVQEESVGEEPLKPSQEGINLEHRFGDPIVNLEDMPSITEDMIQRYKQFFVDAGYREILPVRITSGVDPSVRFIGSHISALKKYVLGEGIPEGGIVTSQPCVRTRNQPKLFDDEYIPGWGSYFKSLGTIVGFDQADKLCEQSIKYLLEVAKIPSDRLVLRVNREDTDLYRLAQQYGTGLRFDDTSMPQKYYRHVLGVDGVWGRNFNYAIEEDGKLYDIGNFIFLENNKKCLGAELALGTSTILKHGFALEHVNSSNPVVEIEALKHPLRFKFEDAVITSTVLLSEGLRPSAKGNQERLLRSYVKALSYFRYKMNVECDDLIDWVSHFEQLHGFDNTASEFLGQYIPRYEDKLLSTNFEDLSIEDRYVLDQILNAMNNE